MKVPREIEAEGDKEVESDEIAAVPGFAVDGEVGASDCYGLGEYDKELLTLYAMALIPGMGWAAPSSAMGCLASVMLVCLWRPRCFMTL